MADYLHMTDYLLLLFRTEEKVQDSEKLLNLWTFVIAFHKRQDSKCQGTQKKLLNE